MSQSHILIIRFSAMGDVAMLVPVVSSLAVQYPDARITVLSRPFMRPFFENLAPNVSFMGADLKGEYKGLSGLNALYRRLTAKRFTHVADMHGVLRSHYLRLRFLMGRYKVAHIDKHRKEKREITLGDEEKKRQLTTSFQNYADVLARLGFPVKLSFRSIYGDMKASLRGMPEEMGVKKPFHQWIGIAPFAAHEGKIYPLDKMEEVVKILVREHPSCRIFLFHGRGSEAEKMKVWEERYVNVVSASMLLKGFEQELALMSNLDVMVSMDSGNMHLASLVGCRVISIWGATHRYAGFLGWNQKEEDVVEVDMPCRPCSVYGNKPCVFGDYPCMKNIKPEQIAEKINAVLK